MSHDIETAFLAQKPAWHGLGNVLTEAPNSTVAAEMGGMNFIAKKCRISVEIPSDFSPATLGVAFSKYITGRYAVVRDTDCRVLGVVSDDYRIVQNSEAFAFTDALVGSGDVRYESGGVLISPVSHTCKTWILARTAKDFTVAGDKIAPYVCFVNSFDGKSSMVAAMVTTRVVCQNTLTMALNHAKRTWSIEHTGDIKYKVNEAQRALGLIEDYMTEFPGEAEKLIARNVYADEVKKFLDDLFPAPLEGDTDMRKKNRQYLKDLVVNRYEKPDDLSRFRNTAWALYNSVSDVMTHMKPLRSTRNWAENRFMRVVDGHDIIQKAQTLLMEIKM